MSSRQTYTPDCEQCFGLCCVALPYAQSADFAFNKDGGSPCKNLQADYRCSIHPKLRKSGFKGCTVYECFGAGQKVSQYTYNGVSWRDKPELAKEMFDVFPVMQQLHEMLCYLYEALELEAAAPYYQDIRKGIEATEQLIHLSPQELLGLHVPMHRAQVNEILLKVSERVRQGKTKSHNKLLKSKDLIGAKLRGADLRGANLRGVLLIASDLRGADLRGADLIGADLRDADLRGANLEGSIFLTQAQVNAALGDRSTKLPPHLNFPGYWAI